MKLTARRLGQQSYQPTSFYNFYVISSLKTTFPSRQYLLVVEVLLKFMVYFDAVMIINKYR
jgi:hypothetical protein